MEKNTLEVTTYIGCKVLCKYCPQDKLLKAYKNLKKTMTLSVFRKILLNVDKDKTKLVFAGFSELFLNKYAVDMLIHAYKKGFEIDVFTTTVGLTKAKILKLKKANVSFSVLIFHLFKSDVTLKNDKFYETVDFFRNNVGNLVYKIVEVKSPISRAGALFKVEKKAGSLICLHNSVYQNVVLPNGDLFLCCNDFELKHKLGNLLKNHYSSDVIEKQRQKMLFLMKCNDSDIACRLCETAAPANTKEKVKIGMNKSFFSKKASKDKKRLDIVNKLKYRI